MNTRNLGPVCLALLIGVGIGIYFGICIAVQTWNL